MLHLLLSYSSSRMNVASLTMTRIRQEIKEMNLLTSPHLYASPLPNDLFTWHFTIRGPTNTPFQHGIYHGVIMLPTQYPLFAPSICFLNASGRFEVGTHICFMNTSFHPEEWNTLWNIRLILESLRTTFNERADGLGHIDSSPEMRRKSALESHKFICEQCGEISKILSPVQEDQGEPAPKKEEKKEEDQKVERIQAQYSRKSDVVEGIKGACRRIEQLKRCLISIR